MRLEFTFKNGTIREKNVQNILIENVLKYLE